MRHSILFRSLAVLLFLTFLIGFVSYHAGVIRADDLMIFSDDTTKRKASSLYDSVYIFYDKDSNEIRIPYGFISTKNGTIMGGSPWLQDSSPSQRMQYDAMTSKSGRIIGPITFDTASRSKLLLNDSDIRESNKR